MMTAPSPSHSRPTGCLLIRQDPDRAGVRSLAANEGDMLTTRRMTDALPAHSADAASASGRQLSFRLMASGHSPRTAPGGPSLGHMPTNAAHRLCCLALHGG